MADNLPIYMNPKDLSAAHNSMAMGEQQQSITRLLHDPMRPEQLWDNNSNYRTAASASAQQQARPPLWDTDKNLPGAVRRHGLDPIDMTVLAGRSQLYAGLPSSAGEQIPGAGAIIPSSVHQMHRGSPSVPVHQAMNVGIPTGSGGKPKQHLYKDGRSDALG